MKSEVDPTAVFAFLNLDIFGLLKKWLEEMQAYYDASIGTVYVASLSKKLKSNLGDSSRKGLFFDRLELWKDKCLLPGLNSCQALLFNNN